ncbi:MAG: hypothetical protein P8Y69_01245 [Gammaproteobacteria bacterium]|jgi:hypothetical protein
MKTKILIEDNHVSITFSPETDIERMCIQDLGDEISVSHRHQDIVLKRRHDKVRRVSDVEEEVIHPVESRLQAVPDPD